MHPFRQAAILMLLAVIATAFQTVIPNNQGRCHWMSPLCDATTSRLAAVPSRRDVFVGTFSILGASVISVSNSNPASATYSAYAAREKDWDERLKKGDVKVSSPRELRRQLKEIVPQNSDARSKVFCPNGTPSNVSPLMENKCSDVLLALPSVYGRTVDAVGNSIPGGFTGGELTSLTAATGGFPRY